MTAAASCTALSHLSASTSVAFAAKLAAGGLQEKDANTRALPPRAAAPSLDIEQRPPARRGLGAQTR